MKRYLLVALVAVTTLVFATGASAYVVNWIAQPFEVKEPISIKVLQAPTSPMWPGSVFNVEYEIANQADVAYGMSYGGYITYYDFGVILKFQLDKQPVKDNDPSVRLLQKPEGGVTASNVVTTSGSTKGGPPISSWGEISFALTVNGNTQPYMPYEVVTINPQSTHGLKSKIRPAADLPPGKWEFNLVVDRGEQKSMPIPR